jgi:hypothetical protein
LSTEVIDTRIDGYAQLVVQVILIQVRQEMNAPAQKRFVLFVIAGCGGEKSSLGLVGFHGDSEIHKFIPRLQMMTRY